VYVWAPPLPPLSFHLVSPLFHLVTKPFSRNCLPRQHELRATVRELAHQCAVFKVPVLAMPKIGAGLDRQPWNWVKQVILEEFHNMDIDILVYLRPGEGRDAYQPTHPDQWRKPRKPARPTNEPGPAEVQLSSTFGPLEEARGINCDIQNPVDKLQDEGKSASQNRQQKPISPLERQMADWEKAGLTDVEKPVEMLTPNYFPGRDGASKAVKATDSLEGDQVGRSNEACLLTGAFSLSAPCPTPAPAQISGESALNLCPAANVVPAKGELKSAPDFCPDVVSSPDFARDHSASDESSIAEIARFLKLKMMEDTVGENEDFSPSEIERLQIAGKTTTTNHRCRRPASSRATK
jgi:hypothetical protein